MMDLMVITYISGGGGAPSNLFYYLQIELENSTQRILNQESQIKNMRNKIKKHTILKGCIELEAEIDSLDNFD